ncbi:uncharacterized protein LOC121263137 [Juglans microcarpa x Juglans regia]|uniref:uncharacterized protein LOC121263137 n=1 Tax=Juglans microcarpa x Juglans regia TaxID=2249226 RepID=UPI001B7DB93E|nr:uncharacterized protein LOC121263137 [Juglans microcarpa x Juglans regia]
MKMDHQERCRGPEQKRSFLQGDEFFQKILSRNSSTGYSSSIYYHRSTEGVPFEWEMQPGTPKVLPKDEVIPPLSPPPAVLSLGLPKPCIQQPKAQTRPKLGFWNKNKNHKESKNNDKAGPRGIHCYTTDADKFDRFELCSSSSDSEFLASPQISSSSSSSSSSLSYGSSLKSSRLQSPGRDSNCGHLSCSPWNISALLVSIARRV